jgi:CRP-like cAMP-binding protein
VNHGLPLPHRLSPVLHHPKQNALLSVLPAADYEHLLVHLELAQMPLGRTVYEPGRPLAHAYFPTSCVVSFLSVLEDGASTEVALTGKEGLIGWPLLTGAEFTHRAIVQVPGYAYRIAARVLVQAFDEYKALRRTLLLYTHSLITQAAQTAVCHRHHTLEQQLCRWLLSMIDRLPGSDFEMTQEAIASKLGVRREGVTEAAHKLQRSGLIACRRGHITIVNRAGMEQHACECYAVMQGAYGSRPPATLRKPGI